jgi:hypothetical protein
VTSTQDKSGEIAGVVLYVSDVSISRADHDARRFDRAYEANREARRRR